MTRESSDPLRVGRAVLASGLTVARQAVPDAARSFAASYIGPAGWAYDPDGAEGLARLVADLAPSAAGRRDRVALARALDELGATLTHRLAPESVEYSVHGPADTFEPLLDLLADVVLRPRLATEDLERVRRQLFERQLREAAQPESRADREVLRTIFPPGHPYRATGLGTRSAVARLTRPQLARFRAGHFTAAGAYLVVTSGRSLTEVVRAIRGRFTGFDREPAPAGPAIPAVRAGGPAPRDIRMPGRAQVEIRIGGASRPRSDPDYPAAFLANEVLGGRPLLSRLFQRVREVHGLAYHASSGLEPMRWGGYWQAQAGTGPERADRATALIRREIARLAREPVGTGELTTIRDSAVGEMPLALETTLGAHELAADVAYHDLPDDWLVNWPRALAAVGPEQLRRAARTWMDPGTAVVVRAGPLGPVAPVHRRQ